MFENNPWKLPEENFEYLIALLKRKQVRLLISTIPGDLAIVDIKDSQYKENIDVAEMNKERGTWNAIVPRVLDLDSYIHEVLTMSTDSIARRIIFSIPKQYRDEDGILAKNPHLEFLEKLGKKPSEILYLAYFVYTACCHWSYFVGNDIDAWARNYGIGIKENREYFKNAFDYDSDICQSLVDIFGQKETEDLIKAFIPKCSCCGEGMEKKE